MAFRVYGCRGSQCASRVWGWRVWGHLLVSGLTAYSGLGLELRLAGSRIFVPALEKTTASASPGKSSFCLPVNPISSLRRSANPGAETPPQTCRCLQDPTVPTP